MDKGERKNNKNWARGAREVILLSHLPRFTQELAKGTKYAREYLVKVLHEFNFKIPYYLVDAKDPTSIPDYDPENPPPLPTLSPEKELERAEALRIRDKRVWDWLVYRARKVVPAQAKGADDTDNPYTMYMMGLMGLSGAPKKARQGWQQYQHENSEYVQASAQRAWEAKKAAGKLQPADEEDVGSDEEGDVGAEDGKAGAADARGGRKKTKKTLGFISEHARELFKALPEQERTALLERAKAEKAAAKKIWDDALNAPPSQEPSAVQKARDLLEGFLGPIMSGVNDYCAGAHVLVLVGGRDPSKGGEVMVKHFGMGTNKQNTHFSAWNPPRFDRNIIQFFSEYLDTVWDERERARMALGAEPELATPGDPLSAATYRFDGKPDEDTAEDGMAEAGDAVDEDLLFDEEWGDGSSGRATKRARTEEVAPAIDDAPVSPSLAGIPIDPELLRPPYTQVVLPERRATTSATPTPSGLSTSTTPAAADTQIAQTTLLRTNVVSLTMATTEPSSMLPPSHPAPTLRSRSASQLSAQNAPGSPTSVPSGTIDVLPDIPHDAPEWFSKALSRLRADLGSEWAHLLHAWVRYEGVKHYGKGRPSKTSRLEVAGCRPKEVSAWIAGGRWRSEGCEPAKKEGKFASALMSAWWAWYIKLVPSWREEDEEGRLDDFTEFGGDVGKLDVPGVNGVLSLIFGLKWVGQALKVNGNVDERVRTDSSWQRAIVDLTKMLKDVPLPKRARLSSPGDDWTPTTAQVSLDDLSEEYVPRFLMGEGPACEEGGEVIECVLGKRKQYESRWNGEFWDKFVTLQDIGLVYQLGHGGLPCPAPIPRTSSTAMTLITPTRISRVAIAYCGCSRSSNTTRLQQLLREGWYPATTREPNTCATFAALDHFELLAVAANVNVRDYISTLERADNALHLLKMP
ncbi:hypothetical protein GGF50DRAFT_92967, partial [Schizophyllum commune]